MCSLEVNHKDASMCFDRFLCFDACRFMSCAFVLSPFSESPRHRNQNLSSSFFTKEGFLPAKEAPGISSSVRITVSESRLQEAIFVVICDAWPTRPRFHVLETRLFRTAAIYEYSVLGYFHLFPFTCASRVLS